jgi:8-oxo-dGTP diphosphatase
VQVTNVAKVLVLNGQNEVLILKRSATDEYRPGKLDLPGGGIDLDEDPFTAVQRELAEEAGITIPRQDLVLLYMGTIFENKLNQSVNRILFACRTRNPTVTLSHEHSNYSWVPFAELDEVYQHHFYSSAIKYAAQKDLLPQ